MGRGSLHGIVGERGRRDRGSRARERRVDAVAQSGAGVPLCAQTICRAYLAPSLIPVAPFCFWDPAAMIVRSELLTLTSIVPAEHLPGSGIDQMHAGASQAGE
jgi:hypothetical protein